MIQDEKYQKYLPLSEATTYVMLTLTEPLHGYAIMQRIKQISQGLVTVGPGTLYGILSALEREGLIRMVSEEERRKCYQLTPNGRAVLALQIRRQQVLVENGIRAGDL